MCANFSFLVRDDNEFLFSKMVHIEMKYFRLKFTRNLLNILNIFILQCETQESMLDFEYRA